MVERIETLPLVKEFSPGVPIFIIPYEAFQGIEGKSQEWKDYLKNSSSYLNVTVEDTGLGRCWRITPTEDAINRKYGLDKCFTIRITSGPTATIDVVADDDPDEEAGRRFYRVYYYDSSSTWKMRPLSEIKEELGGTTQEQLLLFRRIYGVIIFPRICQQGVELVVADKDEVMGSNWEEFIDYLWQI